MNAQKENQLPKGKPSLLLDTLVTILMVPLVYFVHAVITNTSGAPAAALAAMLMLVFAFPMSVLGELRDVNYYSYKVSKSFFYLGVAAMEVVAIYTMLFALIRWFFIFDITFENIGLFVLQLCAFIYYARLDKSIACKARTMHVAIRDINRSVKDTVTITGTFDAPRVTYYRNWLFPVKMVYDESQMIYVVKT